METPVAIGTPEKLVGMWIGFSASTAGRTTISPRPSYLCRSVSGSTRAMAVLSKLEEAVQRGLKSKQLQQAPHLVPWQGTA